MTKANVKFVCGGLLAIVFVHNGIDNFHCGRYLYAGLLMLAAIYCSYLLVCGYKDLPEK